MSALDNKLTGFGRRNNGTCDTSEKDCGPTTRGQHACCPGGMFCDGDDNTVCCPNEGEDCTDLLLETPRCANAEWKMYNNTTPFCCSDSATAAFKTSSDSNICADAGFQPLEGDYTLNVIKQDDDRSSTSRTLTTTDATPISNLTDTSSPDTGVPAGAPSEEPTSDSSTNVGAIAGGVVGGVLGVALILFLFWFLRRKQKKKKAVQQQPESAGPPGFTLSEKDATPNPVAGRFEKDGTTRAPDASELENPDQAGLKGHYRPTPHQEEGERAELS